MKKITIAFAMIFALCFSAAVFAQASPPRIIDNAGLLTAEQKAELTQMIDSVSAEYSFDLVIVTEKNISGKTPTEYADDFFDYNGYGAGEGRDGCLFLQVTDTRDYAFSSAGRGIKILNPYANARLEKEMIPLLTGGNYYQAYKAYINGWEEFLVLDAKGRSYNFFFKNNIALLIGAWVLSFLIGFAIIQSWKKQ